MVYKTKSELNLQKDRHLNHAFRFIAFNMDSALLTFETSNIWPRDLHTQNINENGSCIRQVQLFIMYSSTYVLTIFMTYTLLEGYPIIPREEIPSSYTFSTALILKRKIELGCTEALVEEDLFRKDLAESEQTVFRFVTHIILRLKTQSRFSTIATILQNEY